jgi:ribosomal protein L37AE/L43A
MHGIMITYGTMSVIEEKKEVHTCPICGNGHVNNMEHLSICAKCFRTHNLDLAFAEWSRQMDDQMIKAMKEEVARLEMATVTDWDKRQKKVKFFFYMQLGIIAFWIIATILRYVS